MRGVVVDTLRQVVYIVDIYHMKSRKTKRARVFWTGRSQAVRLPKEFRFAGDTVLAHRQGNAIVLEPADEWPDGYVESFAGVPDDFGRPPQGAVEHRRPLR